MRAIAFVDSKRNGFGHNLFPFWGKYYIILWHVDHFCNVVLNTHAQLRIQNASSRLCTSSDVISCSFDFGHLHRYPLCVQLVEHW